MRSDGLIGFAAGSRLMSGLVETYWDELFAHPDEEGVATRVAPIAGLNGVGREGTLVQPLRKLVLFERPTDGSPFYLYQYEQSFEVAKIADATIRQQRFDRGVLRFDVVESEARAAETKAREAGSPLFALLRDQAADAAEAWQALGQVLDRQAGADAPPTSQIRDLLVQIQDVAKRSPVLPPRVQHLLNGGFPRVSGFRAGLLMICGSRVFGNKWSRSPSSLP